MTTRAPGRKAVGLSKLIALVTIFGWPAVAPAAPQDVPEDHRSAVALPPLQAALLREEMISHTATLHLMLGHLASGEHAVAAELAERELGLSSMGKHAARTAGQGPGRFMPDAMRAIGIGMHRAASAFAEVAAEGDLAASLQALQPVTAACVSCHASYRLVAEPDPER